MRWINWEMKWGEWINVWIGAERPCLQKLKKCPVWKPPSWVFRPIRLSVLVPLACWTGGPKMWGYLLTFVSSYDRRKDTCFMTIHVWNFLNIFNFRFCSHHFGFLESDGRLIQIMQFCRPIPILARVSSFMATLYRHWQVLTRIA